MKQNLCVLHSKSSKIPISPVQTCIQAQLQMGWVYIYCCNTPNSVVLSLEWRLLSHWFTITWDKIYHWTVQGSIHNKNRCAAFANLGKHQLKWFAQKLAPRCKNYPVRWANDTNENENCTYTCDLCTSWTRRSDIEKLFIIYCFPAKEVHNINSRPSSDTIKSKRNPSVSQTIFLVISQ